MRKDLLELAEQENIPLWQNAISHWIRQQGSEKVSLLQLQQALGMPLVEVWHLVITFAYFLLVGWYRGILQRIARYLFDYIKLS